MMAGIPSLAGGATARRLGVCASFVQFPEMRVRCEMKGRLAAIVGVFCIAMLIVSGVFAGKPPTKTPKPDKPRVPGQTKAECIIFDRDLKSAGGTQIEGCCLNAGPWPAYTMDLDLGLTWPDGVVHGWLHIGSWLPGPNGGYVVQFWNWNVDDGPPGPGNFMFEIWGGTVVRDRKSKVVTVTFGGDDSGTLWGFPEGYPEPEFPKYVISNPNVDFVLVRTSDLSYCD